MTTPEEFRDTLVQTFKSVPDNAVGFVSEAQRLEVFAAATTYAYDINPLKLVVIGLHATVGRSAGAFISKYEFNEEGGTNDWTHVIGVYVPFNYKAAHVYTLHGTPWRLRGGLLGSIAASAAEATYTPEATAQFQAYRSKPHDDLDVLGVTDPPRINPTRQLPWWRRRPFRKTWWDEPPHEVKE